MDGAIEAGNWGAVGALAAILASEGMGGTPQQRYTPSQSSRSSGDSSRESPDSTGGGGSSSAAAAAAASAADIDKLVEAGDWQGLVLAAARFEANRFNEADQTVVSATSASSRWTGSATSATTPRSMGMTTEGSATSFRSQAEIRADVDALVRRVVPEDADNVEEMGW